MVTKVNGNSTSTFGGAISTTGAVTASNVGSGILQVVSKTISTQGSQTIGTTDTQIGTGTDFDISITPKGTASKFVVSARWFGEVSGAWNTVFNIQRNGVRINTDGATASNTLGLSMATHTYNVVENNSSTPEMMHVQTVDSTGSTIGTAITYTLVAASYTSQTMWTNRCYTTGASRENGVSELMIMEVAA
tara:strand:- start:584 stop:1156 length:573 start_codon:yes stop_codon:yes gene_type:complete